MKSKLKPIFKFFLGYLAWVCFTIAVINTAYKAMWLLWVPIDPNKDIPFCLAVGMLWYFWIKLKTQDITTNVELVVENNIKEAIDSIVDEAILRERKACIVDCKVIERRIQSWNKDSKNGNEMIKTVEACINQISERNSGEY